MATSNYDGDIVAWANEQAALLRAGLFSQMDMEHLAEEIEDVGKSEKRELASRLAVLLAHLLKCQYQPDLQGNSWRRTIKERRNAIRFFSAPSMAVKRSRTREIPMISQEKIDSAIRILAQIAGADRILMFGSYARGDAREDSDLDLLVIEPQVANRAAEMVRLRRALRPLRIPVDVLVYSADDVARWGDQPGSALYSALREGTQVYA